MLRALLSLMSDTVPDNLMLTPSNVFADGSDLVCVYQQGFCDNRPTHAICAGPYLGYHQTGASHAGENRRSIPHPLRPFTSQDSFHIAGIYHHGTQAGRIKDIVQELTIRDVLSMEALSQPPTLNQPTSHKSFLIVAPNSRASSLLPFLQQATMSFLRTSIPNNCHKFHP